MWICFAFELEVFLIDFSFQYAILEHFSSGNAMALCTDLKNAKIVLDEFNRDDFEDVRHLLSFRKFVESHSAKERIKLLTDDGFLKKKLLEELISFHEYLFVFHVFLNLLHILVEDLPKTPLGKHVRSNFC